MIRFNFRIYSLSFNGVPFYVGHTIADLEVRLSSHLGSALKENNSPLYRFIKGSIDIDFLDSASTKKEAIYFETYWIHQLSQWGFCLINKNQMPNNLKSKAGKLTMRMLDKEHIEKIKLFRKRSDCKIIALQLSITQESVRQILTGMRPARIEHYVHICKYFGIEQRYYLMNLDKIFG